MRPITRRVDPHSNQNHNEDTGVLCSYASIWKGYKKKGIKTGEVRTPRGRDGSDGGITYSE